MSSLDGHLLGLLLCRAGPHRLAFVAQEVTTIEASGPMPCPSARAAYQLPPVPGRVLFTDSGPAVTVDTLEVSPDPLPLMQAPLLVQGHAGGSVFGFVNTQDALWPVLRLPLFSRYLHGTTAHGTTAGT